MTLAPADASRFLRETLGAARVVPVVTIDDAAHARPLAEALVAGGLAAIEVALRTPAALDAIREMSGVSGAVIGAGTLLSAEDARAAKAAGARFGVSPGATDALLDACAGAELPLLPGAATPTEAMRLLERGFDAMKYFPAEASGGVHALAALAAPLPRVAFCPTGGVTLLNSGRYLDLPNVFCVGGSWIATPELVHREAWEEIGELARAAHRRAAR